MWAAKLGEKVANNLERRHHAVYRSEVAPAVKKREECASRVLAPTTKAVASAEKVALRCQSSKVGLPKPVAPAMLAGSRKLLWTIGRETIPRDDSNTISEESKLGYLLQIMLRAKRIHRL